MARPTKYSQELLDKAISFYEKHRADGEIPFIESLALELGVSDDTIVNWASLRDEEERPKYPEFLATYKKIETLQKLMLKKKGLSGDIKPTMPIFLLKANHGMVETARQEISGVEGGEIQVSVVDYAITKKD